MLLATDPAALGIDARAFAGAVSVSGVHDLTPLVLFSFNTDIKLDVGEALRLSPAFLSPRSPAHRCCSRSAANETAEFLRQTWIQWDRWPQSRPRGATAPLIVPGCDHFSVLAEYADGGQRADPRHARPVLTSLISGRVRGPPCRLTNDQRSLKFAI